MSGLQHAYATACKVASNKLAALAMRTVLADPARSRIGMFHAVVADGAPLPDEYACHIAGLMRMVERHQAMGFRFVSLDTLLDTPYRNARNGMCVLTFDDGYEGIYSLAAPYLIAHGIPFTVYIVTDYIGRSGYMSEAQLRALAENPLCTVGSHLVTHPMTRFLRTASVRFELTHSRALLAELAGKPVTHLAFPFGSAYACSLRDRRLAKQAGYRSAALTTPTVYSRCRLLADYSLPRLHMLQTHP